jgi:hypothetical protein
MGKRIDGRKNKTPNERQLRALEARAQGKTYKQAVDIAAPSKIRIERRILMKSAAGLIAVLLVISLLIIPISVTAQTNGRTWNFDLDAVGKPAAGFAFALTGQGTVGQWVVMREPTAPSQPNVLAQTSQDNTDYLPELISR